MKSWVGYVYHLISSRIYIVCTEHKYYVNLYKCHFKLVHMWKCSKTNSNRTVSPPAQGKPYSGGLDIGWNGCLPVYSEYDFTVMETRLNTLRRGSRATVEPHTGYSQWECLTQGSAVRLRPIYGEQYAVQLWCMAWIPFLCPLILRNDLTLHKDVPLTMCLAFQNEIIILNHLKHWIYKRLKLSWRIVLTPCTIVYSSCQQHQQKMYVFTNWHNNTCWITRHIESQSSIVWWS